MNVNAPRLLTEKQIAEMTAFGQARYTGYLAPYIERILRMYNDGCRVSMIADHLYAKYGGISGGFYSYGCDIAGTVNYVLTRCGVDRGERFIPTRDQPPSYTALFPANVLKLQADYDRHAKIQRMLRAGIKQYEIAKALDISRSRVWQMTKKPLRKLSPIERYFREPHGLHPAPLGVRAALHRLTQPHRDWLAP